MRRQSGPAWRGEVLATPDQYRERRDGCRSAAIVVRRWPTYYIHYFLTKSTDLPGADQHPPRFFPTKTRLKLTKTCKIDHRRSMFISNAQDIEHQPLISMFG